MVVHQGSPTFVSKILNGQEQIMMDSWNSMKLKICEYQVIPGNDQNASPTNQKTAGSKLARTS